jgi:hypothetical protein
VQSMGPGVRRWRNQSTVARALDPDTYFLPLVLRRVGAKLVEGNVALNLTDGSPRFRWWKMNDSPLPPLPGTRTRRRTWQRETAWDGVRIE